MDNKLNWPKVIEFEDIALKMAKKGLKHGILLCFNNKLEMIQFELSKTVFRVSFVHVQSRAFERNQFRKALTLIAGRFVKANKN